MAARARTTVNFTREQTRFIVGTPALDDATKERIRQAAISKLPVTLRARQHTDLIRGVGRQVVELGGGRDDQPVKTYRMLEAIIDALAQPPVRGRSTRSRGARASNR